MRVWGLLCYLIAALVLQGPFLGAAESRPNILYIFTDDQSHRTVSAYEEAHAWVETPHIDALAKSGMRFRTCYTGASCQMSRAMMMTGRLQHAIKSFEIRRYPGCDYDPQAQPFWPANFRNNGYQTACIGKWHLGEDVGHGRDWDYSVLWDRMGPKKNNSAYYHGTLVRYNGGQRVPLGGYSTDRYTELAVDYIKNNSTARNKPWFLWLCYGGVHGPYTPADRHQSIYADAPATRIPTDVFGPRPTKPAHLVNYTRWKRTNHGEPAGFDASVKKYNRAVAALDEGVGEIIQALKESGQLKDTLVVYTSDQGFAWGQHGSREKWMGYDANIAAPLIFAHPGRIQPGQVCHEPVTGVDIVSTFHAAAEVQPTTELHGRDLSVLLENPSQALQQPLVFTHTARLYGEKFLDALKKTKGETFVGQQIKPAYLMMREGKYKYIRHMKEKTLEELYDMETDREELTNLAVSPVHAPLLSRLRQQAVDEVRRKDGEFVDFLPAPRVATK